MPLKNQKKPLKLWVNHLVDRDCGHRHIDRSIRKTEYFQRLYKILRPLGNWDFEEFLIIVPNLYIVPTHSQRYSRVLHLSTIVCLNSLNKKNFGGDFFWLSKLKVGKIYFQGSSSFSHIRHKHL